MKEKPILHLGDTVLWKGFPPEVPTQPVRVTGIEQGGAHDFTHNGADVPSLRWKHVKDATVVFDNGHWDYGSNIRRLKMPKAWRGATDARQSLAGMTSDAQREPVEQAGDQRATTDQQHIDFLQGLLEYEWETTPDDSADRKALLHQIEQAQTWLDDLADSRQGQRTDSSHP